MFCWIECRGFFITHRSLSLEATTQAIAESIAAQNPADKVALIAEVREETKKNEEGAIGEPAVFPNFVRTDALTGAAVKTAEILVKGPLVLIFYRGGWCPYCSATLKAYEAAREAITATGATIVAATPEKPEHSTETAKSAQLHFPVVWDESSAIAKSLHIAYEQTTLSKSMYAFFGLDLAARNGSTSDTLPLAATFVVGRDGRIKSAFAKGDWTVRQEPSKVLEVLQTLA
jgi:peroxiredoxin